MKKSLVLFVALLTLGIASAQSKKSLEKDFLNFEKEAEKITTKYNTKLQVLESKITGEKLSEDDEFGDMLGGFGDLDSEGKINTTENIKMFVEMYEHNSKEGGSNYMDFISMSKNPKALKKNEEYVKLVKEYISETKKIESKMYAVAKKYLSAK